MPENDAGVSVLSWIGAAASALVVGVVAAIAKMRDLGRDHTLQIDQHEGWIDHIDKRLDDTHDLALVTDAKVDDVVEGLKRIETNLTTCQTICRTGKSDE